MSDVETKDRRSTLAETSVIEMTWKKLEAHISVQMEIPNTEEHLQIWTEHIRYAQWIHMVGNAERWQAFCHAAQLCEESCHDEEMPKVKEDVSATNFVVGAEFLKSPNVNYSHKLGYFPNQWKANCTSSSQRWSQHVETKHSYVVSILRALSSFRGVLGWAGQHASLHRASDEECVLCMLSEDLQDISKVGPVCAPKLTFHSTKWLPTNTCFRQVCAFQAFTMLLEHCQTIDEAAVEKFQIIGNAASIFTYPCMALFGGLVKNTVLCKSMTCQHVCQQVEVIIGLSVNIPKDRQPTLEMALERAQQEDMTYSSCCARCNTSQTKTFCVARWPELLVVHVRRLDFSISGNQWIKDQTHIHFERSMFQGSIEYALRSVVCHTGGASEGHYTTYMSAESGHWLKCDDETITHCTWETVLKDQGYIFFYEVLL
jgi:hypothetical protein